MLAGLCTEGLLTCCGCPLPSLARTLPLTDTPFPPQGAQVNLRSPILLLSHLQDEDCVCHQHVLQRPRLQGTGHHNGSGFVQQRQGVAQIGTQAWCANASSQDNDVCRQLLLLLKLLAATVWATAAASAATAHNGRCPATFCSNMVNLQQNDRGCVWETVVVFGGKIQKQTTRLSLRPVSYVCLFGV